MRVILIARWTSVDEEFYCGWTVGSGAEQANTVENGRYQFG